MSIFNDEGARIRFWQNVEKHSDGCWLWQGGVRSDGYGHFSIRDRKVRAHRYAIGLDNGVLPNLVVDHTCRNRRCVNPAHLRLVSRSTNIHENSVALGHLNSLKDACPKGHPYSGENLVVRKNGFRRCRECANAYQRELRARTAPSQSDDSAGLQGIAQDMSHD